MKLGIIGVGQAGGKVLDRLLEYDTTRNTGFISHAVAVNSAEQDLQGLEHVPVSNRHLVGQSIVGGQGAGTDPEAGAACVREDIEEVGNAIDRVSATEIDGFVLIAGLGGGTGSGGAPVIAERLGEVYLEPVYGLGILPSTDEGGIYNRNAADTLQRFIERVDSVMLFDNGAFRSSGESLSEGYAGINDEITTRFGTLFSAGEIDGMGDTVAESVVDSSEIRQHAGRAGAHQYRVRLGAGRNERRRRPARSPPRIGRLGARVRLGQRRDEPDHRRRPAGGARNAYASL